MSRLIPLPRSDIKEKSLSCIIIYRHYVKLGQNQTRFGSVFKEEI